MKKTILTDYNYLEFYKTIIYGEIKDSLYTSIHSSYRDLCRTIRGFSKNPKHDDIFTSCEQLIYVEISSMLEYNNLDQHHFDEWHKKTCEKLIHVSDGIITYGQAQKWINMSLKNLSMLEHSKTEKTYEFYHVPVDNYILRRTNYKLSTAWSRLSSYDEYLNFQKWFRENLLGIPLDNEFKMWLEERNKD